MRKQWLKVAGGVAGTLILIALLYAYGIHLFSEPDPLEVGPDATFFDGPLRDDGTIDYYAAVNTRLSEGVTPENNAFVVIAELAPLRSAHPTDPQGEPFGIWEAGLRSRVFAMLDIPAPPEDADYFVRIMDYARQQPDDPRWSEEADIDEPDWRSPSYVWQQQWERAVQRPWSAEDAPLVAEWLEEQNAALDRLREGVRRERYWSPYLPWNEAAERPLMKHLAIPWLTGMREMSLGLSARAMHRIETGDVEGAMEDVLAIKHLSSHLEEPFTLIEQLVGIRIGKRTRHAVVALGQELTVEQARQFKATLDNRERRFRIEHGVGLGERIEALDLVQQTTSRLLLGEELDVWFFRLPRLDRNYVMRRVNDHFDRMVSALAAPTRAQRLKRLSEYREELDETLEYTIFDNPGPSLVLGGRIWADAVADYVVYLYFPALDGFPNASDRLVMFEHLERVALSVTIYQRESGKYPPSLADLVPDLLDEVPTDVFDESGGQIRYRVEDERVVLYSLGENGEDNGGVEAEPLSHGDLVLEWPR